MAVLLRVLDRAPFGVPQLRVTRAQSTCFVRDRAAGHPGWPASSAVAAAFLRAGLCDVDRVGSTGPRTIAVVIGRPSRSQSGVLLGRRTRSRACPAPGAAAGRRQDTGYSGRVAISLNPIVQATVSIAFARLHIQRLTRPGHELSGGHLRVGCELSPRGFGDARGWHSGHFLVPAARASFGGIR